MDYHQPKFYRFSEDSIWLSKMAALHGGRATSVLDIGSGCGVVGIETANLLSTVKELYLLEPQVEFLECIDKNRVLLNKDVELEVVNQTIQDLKMDKSFDLIVSNPPYFNPGHSRPSPNVNKSKCRTFDQSNLREFVVFALEHLNPGGNAFILAREDNKDLKEVLDDYGAQAQVIDSFKEVALLNLIHK
ncbi:MAG: methyltransferase [Bacteriovoracaceae bacterium]|nr:methyltransferase [Bacteriovoracaceae bacterium]